MSLACVGFSSNCIDWNETGVIWKLGFGWILFHIFADIIWCLKKNIEFAHLQHTSYSCVVALDAAERVGSGGWLQFNVITYLVDICQRDRVKLCCGFGCLSVFPPDKTVLLAAVAPDKPVATDGIRSMLIYGNAWKTQHICAQSDCWRTRGTPHGGLKNKEKDYIWNHYRAVKKTGNLTSVVETFIMTGQRFQRQSSIQFAYFLTLHDSASGLSCLKAGFTLS